MSQFLPTLSPRIGAAPQGYSGVAPGTYGSATHFPQITVDMTGRITRIQLIPISGVAGAALGDNDGSLLGDNDGTVLGE